MLNFSQLEFTSKNLTSLLSTFSTKKILVVGDLILDVYLKGEVKRISPEAPVPVLLRHSQESRLGGAGNVALNLKQLNAEVYLFGQVGDDQKGEQLIQLLKDQKINSDLIIQTPNFITSVKTRIIGNQQQIVRIDQEEKKNLPRSSCDQFIEQIKHLEFRFDAIIISDYGKGMINTYLFQRITRYAQSEKIYLALDPKESNFSIYRHLDIMTPNEKEALSDLKTEIKNEQNLTELGNQILKKHRLKHLIITRGRDGMIVFDQHHATFIPSFTRSVFDVSGAGDTVIATYVLSYLSNHCILHAAIIANLAAGIVVSKFGTSTVQGDEIIKEFNYYQQNHFPDLIRQEKLNS